MNLPARLMVYDRYETHDPSRKNRTVPTDDPMRHVILALVACSCAALHTAPRLATSPRRAPVAVLAALETWQEIEIAKGRLLSACESSGMGYDVGRRAAVLGRIEELEKLNPTPKPLESPDLLTGCWRLVYTTSDSILGTTRPRPFKPNGSRILQSLDASKLAAKNEEWVLGGLLKNQVKAELEPRDDGRTVDVQFKRFGIGWLRIPAPAAARGVLETTFLDESLRISRGDKGNLFVLVRQGASRV